MSYAEKIREIKAKLEKNEPVWLPERNTLFVPPSFLVWLAADDIQIACIRGASQHETVRYIATGKVGNFDILPSESDELREHRDTVLKTHELVRTLEEPYRTRFSAFLMSVT